MPASERDVGVERSLHARAGCGFRPRSLWCRSAVSPRARGMREVEHESDGGPIGLSTRARDAGSPTLGSVSNPRSLHARAGCGE